MENENQTEPQENASPEPLVVEITTEYGVIYGEVYLDAEPL